MSIDLANITFDCANPPKMAAFWSAVTDRPVDEGASAFFASIGMSAADRPRWLFLLVDEAKTANPARSRPETRSGTRRGRSSVLSGCQKVKRGSD